MKAASRHGTEKTMLGVIVVVLVAVALLILMIMILGGQAQNVAESADSFLETISGGLGS